MYRSPYRLRQNPGGLTKSDYGEFLTQATINALTDPLSVSGPGDISKWMAVPWQTDTASCRAGYPGTEFPPDPFIPTFWPLRVPNNGDRRRVRHNHQPGHISGSKDGGVQPTPVLAAQSAHECTLYRANHERLMTHFGGLWVNSQARSSG